MGKTTKYAHLTCLILGCLILLPHRALAGDVRVTTRTVFDIDEILRRDFTFRTRQRFSQQLGVSATDLLDTERHRLHFRAQMRVDTDFQRRFRETARDLRDQEAADVILQLAYLDYTPLDELIIRVGRQVLYGALNPVDVDGLRLAFEGALGICIEAAAGREVRYDLKRVDAPLFDTSRSRWSYFEDAARPNRWLTHMAVGWTSRPVRFRLGHRLGVEDGGLSTQHTGLAVEAGTGPFRATARATLNHIVLSPERLETAIGVSFPTIGLNASAAWRYLRPSFDSVSIFNAFPLTPSVGWILHATVEPSRVWGISASTQLRAFGLDEETPWSGGIAGDADRRAVLGRLSAHYLPMTQLRLSLAAGIEEGYGGLLVDGDGAVLWTAVPDRLEMSISWRQAYRNDEGEGGQQGHIASGRLRGEYRLADFGRLVLLAEYLADYRYTARFRLLAGFDFDLEVL